MVLKLRITLIRDFPGLCIYLSNKGISRPPQSRKIISLIWYVKKQFQNIRTYSDRHITWRTSRPRGHCVPGNTTICKNNWLNLPRTLRSKDVFTFFQWEFPPVLCLLFPSPPIPPALSILSCTPPGEWLNLMALPSFPLIDCLLYSLIQAGLGYSTGHSPDQQDTAELTHQIKGIQHSALTRSIGYSRVHSPDQ
jgi:hypothetical protein